MNQDLLKGISEIINEDTFKELLKSKKKLTIKFGADPSAPDLHLGHTVVLRKLKEFQELGHNITFLIGNFTAMIGDPTGKSKTRKSLSAKEVQEYANTYQDQVFKILDRNKTTVVYNADWLDKLSAKDLIHITAQYNVARMLERDDFNKRFKSNQSISLHEFIYPLLQGYDSVHLKADIEIGGTDQKFNLLVGRHLQKEAGQTPQVIITMPILEGLDGVNKMSKSLGNHIGLTDTPNDMFGKIMSIPDNLILKYFELLTNTTTEELKIMTDQMGNDTVNPRDLKAQLGKTIVELYYDKETANASEEAFIQQFKKKELPDSIEDCSLSTQNSYTWAHLLTASDCSPSNKESSRLIQQGAVSYTTDEGVSWTKISNPTEIALSFTFIIKAGKRRFKRILWEKD
ncbi:MAG: tyrosine--tRNA ligase [Candidatus Margulisbacteria bacterium GWF2_35_9]|nr:MAG: tyrosine--tRNA ligase [Candidatus Margulisbacteria bacterium GWF2_35_9]